MLPEDNTELFKSSGMLCAVFREKRDDNINKPAHYNQGSVDLIESWYRTYPWSQFVAIMESHIDKYIKRHRYKDNALQDLDKAVVYIERLKYYTSVRLEGEDEI